MQNTFNPSRRYRNDLLIWRASQLGLNYQAISRLITTRNPELIVNGSTVKRVFSGVNATFDTVWAITDALEIDRQAIANFKLKQKDFSSAVLGGGPMR